MTNYFRQFSKFKIKTRCNDVNVCMNLSIVHAKRPCNCPCMAGHIFYLRTRPVSMVSIWSVCCTDSLPEGALTASFTPATDSPSLPAKRRISKYFISPNTVFIMISFSYEIIKMSYPYSLHSTKN